MDGKERESDGFGYLHLRLGTALTVSLCDLKLKY
jgi:hypothetical protein